MILKHSQRIVYLEFCAGTDIRDACEEACALALSEDVVVRFNFNGVEVSDLSALKNGPELMAKFYHEKLAETKN